MHQIFKLCLQCICWLIIHTEQYLRGRYCDDSAEFGKPAMAANDDRLCYRFCRLQAYLSNLWNIAGLQCYKVLKYCEK